MRRIVFAFCVGVPLTEVFEHSYSDENFPNILKLADGLKKIGERHNATAGQVALAWLLGQGEDIIPIPGTTKLKARVVIVLRDSRSRY